MAYRSLMSARVICCGDSRRVGGRELCCILLDDDNVISDCVEKAIVANLAAGAAMNTARSVFNETDLMVVGMARVYIEIEVLVTDAMVPICEMNAMNSKGVSTRIVLLAK